MTNTHIGTYELDRVHLGDCIELMKALPDKCVDCVVTDPPYGIGVRGKVCVWGKAVTSGKDYGDVTWDCNPMTKEQRDEIFRTSQNQIIWGGNYFDLPPTPCILVWDKDNTGSGFADCEIAWTSFKTSVRKFKWKWHGMIQEQMGRDKEQRFHPTQKPVALMKWIIEKYTSQDALILDPFAGSGTTGVAAIQTGRRFLGFEIDPRWCDLANKRIEAAKAQGVLNLG